MNSAIQIPEVVWSLFATVVIFLLTIVSLLLRAMLKVHRATLDKIGNDLHVQVDIQKEILQHMREENMVLDEIVRGTREATKYMASTAEVLHTIKDEVLQSR